MVIIDIESKGNHSFIRAIADIICILAWFFLLLPASDARTDFNSNYTLIALVVLVLILILRARKRVTLLFDRNFRVMFILWGILIIGLFFSNLFGDAPISVVAKFFLIFSFYILLIPSSAMNISYIAFAALLLNYYIAYRSFIQMGVLLTSHYSGTSINSNQFALILVGGLLSSVYLFFKSCDSFFRFISFVCMLLSYFLIWFSSSRSVMIVSVFATLLFIFLRQQNIKYHGKPITCTCLNNFLKILIFIGLIIFIIEYRVQIYDFIFAKWDDNNDTTLSGLLSGRPDIWRAVINDASILGHFGDLLNANNDYLFFLQQYGLLPFVCFALICIATNYMGVKNYKSERTIDSIFILIIVVSYCSIAFLENIHAFLGKSINVLFLSCIGILISNRHTVLSRHVIS